MHITIELNSLDEALELFGKAKLFGMAAESTIPSTVPTQKVIKGINKLARELNCSPCHLSHVLHGNRKPSDELAKALEERGYITPTTTEVK